jgi:GTPase SAR1 family protein
LSTEGLERLGTLLLYASEKQCNRIEKLVLVEKRIKLHVSSLPELSGLFVRNRAINLLLLGDSGAGKTQLEARLRGLKSDPCLHTLGANSVSAGIRLKRQSSKGSIFKTLILPASPSEAPAIPGSDFVLGDVLEIGGQHEYRYLYQVGRRPVPHPRHRAAAARHQALETLKASLLERMQLLWHRYSRESQLHCPAILVVVNCTREQVSGNVNLM